MRALLGTLEQRTPTLTVYDYDGTDERLQSLADWLNGYGVVVRTAESGGARSGDAVFRRDGRVLGTCSVEDLLARSDFETAIDGESDPPLPDPLPSVSGTVTVRPNRSVREMVRISREFERRALRQGAGRLHAGFQHLSVVADSARTLEMYTSLAREGVDVWVYGYPDTALGDVPFTVVKDDDREFERNWFLLYDGEGNPARKAALVSEECEGKIRPTAASDAEGTRTYDSFFTTDPETVDDLFELARAEYGDLFAGR
jgi:hypothetical protein